MGWFQKLPRMHSISSFEIPGGSRLVFMNVRAYFIRDRRRISCNQERNYITFIFRRRPHLL